MRVERQERREMVVADVEEGNKKNRVESRRKWGLTVAGVFVLVGLVAGFAEASAAEQVPVAVALAQVLGRRVLDGVGHADAVGLFDRRQLAAGRRGREDGERGRHLGARDVVDADGQQRDARALVAEREVHALLRHRDRAHLRVDDHLPPPRRRPQKHVIITTTTSSSASSSSAVVSFGLPHSHSVPTPQTTRH